MTTDILQAVPAVNQALGVGNAATAAPVAPESQSFQRLLESLQKLVDENRRASEGGGGPEQLQNALQAADEGFVTAMDLRQKLEAAFRAHRP
jgi:hypothetical protein